MPPAAVSRRIASLFFRGIRGGSLTIEESERRRTYGAGSPVAEVLVHSRRAWPLVLRGSRGIAEAYARELWESPDLTEVIRVAARNAPALDRLRRPLAPLFGPWRHARSLLALNTPRRARRDIAAHYDMGNDLFALMLDATMSYSCALFTRADMTLEQASIAKLERACERLDLRASDRVLEIGSGWGGFAVHAARTRGCHVTTTTISRAQHAYALGAVQRAGLEDRVTVLLEDYRELRGRYDKLVSIEMIEAVGWRHFGTFFKRCSQLLEPDGAMFLQAITIDDRAYDAEKATRSFINTYIFPGGCLPSLEIISREVARNTDLSAVSLDDITPHYVETLRRWRTNFERNAAHVAALGYDERFRRLWRLYLSYCEAGFAERRIRDLQIVLAKPMHRLAAAAGQREPAPALVATSG